jgi:hypothetical protein
VKENRHTTSLITSAIRQWINNVQVECNVFISRMSYLDVTTVITTVYNHGL